MWTNFQIEANVERSQGNNAQKLMFYQKIILHETFIPKSWFYVLFQKYLNNIWRKKGIICCHFTLNLIEFEIRKHNCAKSHLTRWEVTVEIILAIEGQRLDFFSQGQDTFPDTNTDADTNTNTDSNSYK